MHGTTVKKKVEPYLYSPFGLHGLFQRELYLYLYYCILSVKTYDATSTQSSVRGKLGV
jgi:hypothetical protein